MASNPRIDDLRKRLDREPQSRLFAQLAEELRKEGDLKEAIRVARQGLEKHPNYPSARMTLGRALFDSRDFAAARTELESVVKGAPDNILAGRLLAECLEAVGDVPGAVERYKATLLFSPGDKQVQGRLQALEAQASSGPAPPAEAPLPPAEPVVEPAVAPEPVAAPAGGGDPPPIPLVEADEEFELEQPFAAPRPSWPLAARSLEAEVPAEPPVTQDVGPPPESAPEPKEASGPASVVEFELEAPHAARSTVWSGPAATDAPVSEAAPAPVSTEPAPPPEPPAPPAPDVADLTSATLAELYFNQGALDRAVDAYRRLLEREPGNERFRARLTEIEGLERHLRAEEPAAAAPPAPSGQERRQSTIVRLEGFLAAIKRG